MSVGKRAAAGLLFLTKKRPWLCACFACASRFHKNWAVFLFFEAPATGVFPRKEVGGGGEVIPLFPLCLSPSLWARVRA